MSEAYEQPLVPDESSAYERFAAATVGASFLGFLVGVGGLFDALSLTRPVLGVALVTLVGVLHVGLGVAVGALGFVSRFSGFDTDPSASPGFAVGAVMGFVWSLTAGFVASSTLGLGTVGWALALLVGLGVGYGTLLLPEDVGSSVPVAAFLVLVGGVVLTGLIAPGWAWRPEMFDAAFPADLVVPFLTVFSSLLAGWTGAKANVGFGTRGRQNGVFLLISLVVFVVLSILVLLLAFVLQRGVGALLENVVFGAGTVLVIALSAVVLLARRARGSLRFQKGTDAVRSFVLLGVLGSLGVLSLVPVYAIVSGTAFPLGSVTIRPSPTVGAVPGLIFGGFLLVVLRRSTDRWEPDTEAGRRVEQAGGVALKLLGLGIAAELLLGMNLAAGGVPIVAAAAILVGLGGAVATGVGFFGGRTADRTAVPPPSAGASVLLGSFLVVCLHVVVTGSGVTVGSVVLVDSGTLDWPFLMNPSQGLGIQRGVLPAILGTVWIVAGALVMAVPLAVGAAVYLTEYASDSAFTKGVDIATNGLWSTPSIVFGLFGLAFVIPRFNNTPSIFAAQLVLGFMLLPLVLITSREAMKTVPDEYRDASAALGVSKWQTIRSVVVPAAMPGVITGTILGVGRIAGETAPLLLVLNGPNFPGVNPEVLSNFEFSIVFQPPFVHVTNPALLERASALPYQLYAIITAGVGAESDFGWATALTLLGVVLSFYAVGIASRRYFRSKLEQ